MLFTGLMLLPGLLLALIAVLLVAWAVPPFRLVYSGYGELVLAILWANLLPAFAFILQTGEIHRILPLITIPLTFLALACLLVSSFPTFAADQHYARRTLLTRLTWQRAVPLHPFLLAAAYLLFTAAPLFGFPWSLLWPAYLTLPGAVAQGIWLQRIAQGGRTLWKSYMVLAAAVFGLTIYFLALTSWIR
jgi:1,4-dihydroxy-2-naphthoate octaprenyltransferase